MVVVGEVGVVRFDLVAKYDFHGLRRLICLSMLTSHKVDLRTAGTPNFFRFAEGVMRVPVHQIGDKHVDGLPRVLPQASGLVAPHLAPTEMELSWTEEVRQHPFATSSTTFEPDAGFYCTTKPKVASPPPLLKVMGHPWRGVRAEARGLIMRGPGFNPEVTARYPRSSPK